MLEIEFGAAELRLAIDDKVAVADELVAGAVSPLQAASQSTERISSERVARGQVINEVSMMTSMDSQDIIFGHTNFALSLPVFTLGNALRSVIGGYFCGSNGNLQVFLMFYCLFLCFFAFGHICFLNLVIPK